MSYNVSTPNRTRSIDPGERRNTDARNTYGRVIVATGLNWLQQTTAVSLRG